MDKVISAALYMRLSRDDDQLGESASIETQRVLLRQYAYLNGIDVYDEYADDGYTGTNFERPDFKRLIADISAGYVNCVITKDLSRFGREHVQMDYYLETFFPENGVRYIAVTENEDSANGLSDFVPFKNLFNEWYARDTSRKIRAAFAAKFKNGEYAHGRPPFGYDLSPDRKTLVPNPDTAPVVKKMFEMANNGYGTYRIVSYLYENRVPVPSYWHGMCQYTLDDDDCYNWKKSAVRAILKNPIYTGDNAHHRMRRVSYKSKKSRRMPESEWVWTHNSHQGIITRDEFDAVQQAMARRSGGADMPKADMLFNNCYCATCGRLLRPHRCYSGMSDGTANKVYVYYGCVGKQTQARAACSGYSLRQEKLCEYVTERLNEWRHLALQNDSNLVERILRRCGVDSKSGSDADSLDRRRDEIKVALTRMYEDRLKGAISEGVFNAMSEKYQAELQNIDDEIERNIRANETRIQMEAKAVNWVERLKQMDEITELTAEIIDAMIEKIALSVIKENGVKRSNIVIYYRFVGDVD